MGGWVVRCVYGRRISSSSSVTAGMCVSTVFVFRISPLTSSSNASAHMHACAQQRVNKFCFVLQPGLTPMQSTGMQWMPDVRYITTTHKHWLDSPCPEPEREDEIWICVNHDSGFLIVNCLEHTPCIDAVLSYLCDLRGISWNLANFRWNKFIYLKKE